MSASRLLNSVYNALWLCWGGMSLRRTFVLAFSLTVWTAGALTGATVEANAFLIGKQTFVTRAFVDQHGVVYQSVAVRGFGGFEPGFKRSAGQFVDTYSQLDSGPNRQRSDHRGRRTRSRLRVERPTVSNLSLHTLGGARVAGRCAPSHRVLISLDGRMSRSVACGRDGRFVAELEEPFGAGEHLVATSVRLNSGNVRFGQDVRVFIPEGFAADGYSHDRKIVVPDVRDYAEELAQAASERFSQLTQAADKTPPEPQTDVLAQKSAGANQTAPAVSESTADSSDDPYQVLSDRMQWGVDEIGSWQRYSIDTYFRKVVPKLSTGSASAGEDGGENASTLADVPLPSRPVGSGAVDSIGAGISSYLSGAQDWFERANKDYQKRVVRSLSNPVGDGLPEEAASQDELPSPVDVPETAKVEPRDDVVRPDGRETVGSPAGRLAAPSQISASNAASQREAARLSGELAKQGGQVAPLDQASDKTVAAVVGDKDSKEQGRAAKEKKRLVDLKARLARSRFEEQRRGEAERAKAYRDKKREQERTAARLKAKRLAEAKQAKIRERQKELTRLEQERRLSEVKAATMRAAQLKAERDDGRDAERKRESNLGESTVALPSRSPNQSSMERADLASSERSALGARDVALPERKQKTARKRSVGKPRVKSRRARRSKKARRRVAVRSYRARRKARKRRLRRGRKTKTYVVRRGDTLWDIARRYYGAGYRYKRIHRANRKKIRNPHMIWPRQRIRIPGSRR